MESEQVKHLKVKIAESMAAARAIHAQYRELRERNDELVELIKDQPHLALELAELGPKIQAASQGYKIARATTNEWTKKLMNRQDWEERQAAQEARRQRNEVIR